MTAAFKRKKIDVDRVSQAARSGWAAQEPGVWRVGEVREVPLDQIAPNPDNARVWYATGPLSKLAASIRTTGQLSPALAFLGEKQQLTLIDGHRRWKAAGLAGLTHVRVELREPPASRQDLYLRSRDANQLHSAQTALDDAVAWKRLLADKVFRNQRDLALFVGVSDTEVSRILALARLPSELLELLSAHEDLCQLKVLNAVREFFEASDLAQTQALVDEMIRTGMGYREVENRRARLSKAPAVRKKNWAVPVELGSARGTVRLTNEGQRLELSLAGLQAERAQQLAQDLKHWLAAREPAAGAGQGA